MYYFAYGSNLSHAQMKRRCPSSQFIEVARLDGYKLIFCGYSARWQSSGANILLDPDSCVWGAVYQLDAKDQAVLDTIEAEGDQASFSCKRFDTQVVTTSGRRITAGVYQFSEFEPQVAPGTRYLSTIREGIADCRLEQYEHVILSTLQ